MQCPNCGKAVREKAKFCQSCGTPLPAGRSRAKAAPAPRRASAQGAADQRIASYRIVQPWEPGERIRVIETVAVAPGSGRFLAIEESRPLPRGYLAKWQKLEPHPNLARVRDEIKDARGKSHLIVGYVEGQTLHALPVPLHHERALRLALELLQILDYMHTHGWCLRSTRAALTDSVTESMQRFQRAFAVSTHEHLMLLDYTIFEPMPLSPRERYERIKRDMYWGSKTLYWIATGEQLGRNIEIVKREVREEASQLQQVLFNAIQNLYPSVKSFADGLAQLLPKPPSPARTVPRTRPMAIGVTAPLPQLTAKARTDGGRKRDHNEDKYSTYLVDGSSGFFIVADGMGGHAAGEVASQMAIQEITQSATAGWNRMAQGGSPDAARGYINAWITKANQKIFALGQAKRNNMGTTLTAAFVANGQVYAANVGDSRTYLVREGQLYPLTRDHSLVASLVQAGLLEPEAVYNHPQRNEIFRSLGQQSDVNVDVFEPVPLQPGDRLLLCSDGLWEMVRESEMQEILARNPDPQSACNELTRVANEHGGEDNITVVLAQFARG